MNAKMEREFLKNIVAVSLLVLAADTVLALDSVEPTDAIAPISAPFSADCPSDSANLEEESDTDSNEEALIFTEQLFQAYGLLLHVIANDRLPSDISVHITPPPKCCLA